MPRYDLSPADASASTDASDPAQRWRRADLHCHSVASTEADEAVLNALACPECYSDPRDVYAQARQRGMDFVTITDHDCIDGILSLGRGDDLIVGEELTCYFPEDRCKMHVLVWGIDRAYHDALQARAADIYAVAEYIERHNIAHAVAHPLYRQNDLLGRWHLERLVLLFKGFEAVNGAHSQVHRDAIEPFLQELTREHIEEYAARHGLPPRWPEPHIKSRTGGSDDHGLLNIGRTWTEFPPDVRTPAQALEAIRTGRCRPGGEPGSSLKLAHNFVAVGVRYWLRNLSQAANGGRDTLVTHALRTLVGERRRTRKRDVAWAAIRHGLRSARSRLVSPFRRRASPGGMDGVGRLAVRSFLSRSSDRAFLGDALRRKTAPLGEHDDVFRLITSVQRDMTAGVLRQLVAGLSDGHFAALFEGGAALAAAQSIALPYLFALFHQNKERQLCGGITARPRDLSAESVRIGLFTDTFDEVNGVARFLARLGGEAARRNRSLSVATCSSAAENLPSWRKNFAPVAEMPLPHYPELRLTLPPILEVLEWADRQQFDVIHVSTPGPMGLVGMLVAKMLRVPLVATYHTDFPAFVRALTGDYRLTAATVGYMGWFYSGCAAVFARSRGYQAALAELGVNATVTHVLPPCTDTDAFHPRHRQNGLFERLGVREPLRILYVGRVSAEKNLAVLASAFDRLSRHRHDVALVVVGDGPYAAEMQRQLSGKPAYFLGYRQGETLAALYASADLFVFPSRTDTLGQAVLEAQASGITVIVSDAGGPREVMDDGVTGRIVAGDNPNDWAEAIDDLLDDVVGRLRMGRTAAQRAARFSRADLFDAFWDQHVESARQALPGDVWCQPSARPAASETAADLTPAAESVSTAEASQSVEVAAP
jgi:glycosyltransferase involved in cell wall biosynthesis/predicted metal-dependent phosphoesterase TrpH